MTLDQYEADMRKTDIQMMKVIHDLKNPIMSIKQIVNNEEYDLSGLDLNGQYVYDEYTVDNENSIIETSFVNEDKYNKINQSINNNNNSRMHSLKRRLSNVAFNNYNNESYLSISKVNLTKSSKRIGNKIVYKDSEEINQNTIEHIQKVQKQVNTEVEDIEEMIENLKMQFKSKNMMEFNEEVKEIKSVYFLESFKNTFIKLSESSKNYLILSIKEGFPYVLEIQKSLVKRIVNNFISNSLKHTKNGKVEIIFKIIPDNLMFEYKDMIELGAELHNSSYYMCFEVMDNGSGIPPDKLYGIFDEKYSDQSGQNWDGCGLGLPICEKLAKAVKARIYYNSKGNQTKFCLIFNYYTDYDYNKYKESFTINCEHEVIENKYLINDINIEIDYRSNDVSINLHRHVCNSLIIAEDNKNILNRYVKHLDTNSIPYMTFMNGSDCLSYIKDEINHNCQKCSKLTLITDYYMPYMDGKELAEEIIKIDINKKIYIVLLSADEPTDELKERKLFDEILIKPIEMKLLKNYYIKMKMNTNDSSKNINNKNSQLKPSNINSNFEIYLSLLNQQKQLGMSK